MKFTDALARAVGNGRPPVPYTSRSTRPPLLTGLGGARMSLLNAMGANGTLFAIVSRYANATAQVEWKLWRKSRSGLDEDRTQVRQHLALDVWSMPNAYSPGQLFREATQQHVDLVGEAWWVIDRNMFGWPESMWVVRPDRIAPVPSAERGVAGYVYTTPDGAQVPLEAENVIRLRQPHPGDPGPAGRGLGAVQTILAQVEAVHFSAQWNRNFFANSAVPGGIITVPETLDDRSFDRLRMQWGEQHQGVSAAHRVGILEGGATFVEGTSHRDMEFTELLNTSRDVIREAFAMPKFMLGLVDDVNRATAEASDAAFGSWGLVPRLERIKQALNTQYLPMFGPSGHGTGQPDVEFDYESPVPPDAAAEQQDLTARVNAYVALVRAGVDPADASSTTDLPLMGHIAEPATLTGSDHPGVPAHA
jgi:HK97 family phage portal protein